VPDLIDDCLRAFWSVPGAGLDDHRRMQAVLLLVANHIRHLASADHIADQLEAAAGCAQPPTAGPAPLPVAITDARDS